MGGETAGDDYRWFLSDVLAALGWDQPSARDVKTEAHVLAEIRRLRNEAGENDDGNRPLIDIEHLSVSRVNQVGGPEPRPFSLWLTTRAGTVETHSQALGSPWRTDFVEHPERNLLLLMDEHQARQIHDILTKALGRADSGEGP
jgi:hypothetical protein